MSKHTKILLFLAIVLVSAIILFESGQENDNYIFNEDVSFGKFFTVYNESFKVKNDTNLIISMNTYIEEGVIYLSIYSDDGEIIYEKEGQRIKETTKIPIHKGTWYYHFECSGIKGKKETYAENGNYKVNFSLEE